MADFKVDTDMLDKTIKVYDESIQKLLSIKTDINTKIENLKDNDWKSVAGDKFLKSYNDDWAKKVVKYADVVGLLKQLLEKGKSDYEELIEESNKIKFQ